MDENKKINNPEENMNKAGESQPISACDDTHESVSVLMATRAVLLRRVSSLIVAMSLMGGIFVVTHGGLGWFSSNSTVAGGAFDTTMQSSMFNTGVELDGQGERKTTVASIVMDLLTANGFGEGLISGDTMGVVCGFNIYDTNDGSNTTIRPGTQGEIVFRILPESENCTFGVTTMFKGITEVGDEEIALADPSQSSEAALALNYMKGHILLSADSSLATDGAINPNAKLICPDDAFYVSCPGSSSDYQVTLYWKWPRTYNNLTDVLNGLNASWKPGNNLVLYNGNEHAGYNNADQIIGDVAKYLAVQFDIVEKAIPLNAAIVITADALN